MPSYSVVIAAAGQSRRFQHPGDKKPFIKLNQKPVFLHSIERFQKRRDVIQTIIVIAEQDREDFFSRFDANVAVLGLDVVIGGAERSDSIGNALQKVDSQADLVAIHDAARPCVPEDDIESVFQAAAREGAAILGTPINSTLKRVDSENRICQTVDRRELWAAQTPQVFRREWIQEAYRQIGDFQPTDEAQLFERLGRPVTLVEGSPLNIKITRREDIRLAAACLEAMPKPKFDAPIHPFADDRDSRLF